MQSSLALQGCGSSTHVLGCSDSAATQEHSWQNTQVWTEQRNKKGEESLLSVALISTGVQELVFKAGR